MSLITLLFKAHQPVRFREYSFFELGKHQAYFNDNLNHQIINRVSDNCYLPTNNILLNLINQLKGKFKFAMSISGTLLDQLEIYRPDVIQSFKKLVDTGQVELICEPYYHTLACFYSSKEFEEQVLMHKVKIEQLFGISPDTFSNTELIFSDKISRQVSKIMFKNILSEGVSFLKMMQDGVNFTESSNLRLLLRNHALSNDLAFRFSDKNWPGYPLNAKKYKKWVADSSKYLSNIFIDYETFGEHNSAETGIFKFFINWVKSTASGKKMKFEMLKNISNYKLKEHFISVDEPISWADHERDISAWRGNSMQYESLSRIFRFEKWVKQINDELITKTWRYLQTSDHFYYMSTKGFTDGNVHNYFSPFKTPHDAYRCYMNIISDFELVLKKKLKHLAATQNTA